MAGHSKSEAVFYAVDRHLVIRVATDEALRIWGKPRSEVVGRGLLDVFPFIAGTEIHQAHLEALRSYKPVRLQAKSHYLSGLVEVEIYPVEDGLQVRYWQQGVAQTTD